MNRGFFALPYGYLINQPINSVPRLLKKGVSAVLGIRSDNFPRIQLVITIRTNAKKPPFKHLAEKRRLSVHGLYMWNNLIVSSSCVNTWRPLGNQHLHSLDTFDNQHSFVQWFRLNLIAWTGVECSIAGTVTSKSNRQWKSNYPLKKSYPRGQTLRNWWRYFLDWH